MRDRLLVHGNATHVGIGSGSLQFLGRFGETPDFDENTAELGPSDGVFGMGVEPLLILLNNIFVLETDVDREIGEYFDRVTKKIEPAIVDIRI